MVSPLALKCLPADFRLQALVGVPHFQSAVLFLWSPSRAIIDESIPPYLLRHVIEGCPAHAVLETRVRHRRNAIRLIQDTGGLAFVESGLFYVGYPPGTVRETPLFNTATFRGGGCQRSGCLLDKECERTHHAYKHHIGIERKYEPTRHFEVTPNRRPIKAVRCFAHCWIPRTSAPMFGRILHMVGVHIIRHSGRQATATCLCQLFGPSKHSCARSLIVRSVLDCSSR